MPKKKTVRSLLKRNKQKGKIEKGAMYVVVFLVSLIFLGYLFVGGTLPTTIPEPSDKIVEITPGEAVDKQNTLQMQTFKGALITQRPHQSDPEDVPPPPIATLTEVDCETPTVGNEQIQIIWATRTGSTKASDNQPSFQVFYGDDTPIPVGNRVMLQSPADKTTNPILSGGRDGNQFPRSPALFITDITDNPNDTSGDAQNGGVPQTASTVFGAWKTETGADPTVENFTNLTDGGDAWPAANGPFTHNDRDLTWTAELVWKIGDLQTNTGQPLQAGHTYRLQIALHDGEDGVAQYCLTATMPTT